VTHAAEESQLRLFLSVDIVGSTALKGEANYQTIAAHLRMLQRATKVNDPSNIPTDALPSLDEYDWVAIQQNTFGDFHSEFSKTAQPEVADAYEVYPWKALGDELIYSIRLRSRSQATKLVTSFISALRLIDKQLSSKGRIRLKAVAWVAGFPIGNRIVQIPAPTVFYRQLGEDVPFPYPRLDFWGPDMDIGFRLSRCTFPGMCVTSAGLVELLAADKSNDQVRFAHVGWEKLKGVWHERPYPIFWAELPSNSETSATIVVLPPWAIGEGPFVRNWETDGSKREAKSHQKLLAAVREAMPANFGLVRPYIPEEDGIPPDHQALLELIGKLPMGAAGNQNTEIEERAQGSETDDEARRNVEELMARIERLKLFDPQPE
jgi:hypothetical protein